MENPCLVELEEELCISDIKKEELNNINQYDLKINNDLYKLKIDISSKGKIIFELRQLNYISFDYYSSTFKYEDILNQLNLDKTKYDNINKILELFDLSIKNKNFKITKKDNNNERIFINLEIKEKGYIIYLDKTKISEKAMLNILIEEINEIKNKQNLNNDKFELNKINNENIDNIDDIKKLEDELKKIDEEIIRANREKEKIKVKINILKRNKEKNKGGVKNNEIKNIIKMKININNNDIDKEIYFLHNSFILAEKLNESNVDFYFSYIKYKFPKNLKFKIEGIYNIKLIFKKYIKNCKRMFYNCQNIINIDLSSFDAQYVNDMTEMFYGCSNLTNINLSSLNTKNVTSLSHMFDGCTKLKIIDFSNFNTKNVIDMSSMFYNCSNLINIDLSSFNTENIKNINNMFSDCLNLENIDLSYFNTKTITNLSNMFYRCYKLKKIKISKNGLKIIEDVDDEIVELIQ